MPAIYAHRAFGNDIVKLLPRGSFPEVFACPEAFALGLHGPDVLFYFHPLGRNAVNRRGEELHLLPAAPFFARARELLLARGNAACERAYLYGFLCHFALDSTAHPEVYAQMAAHAHTHAAVEAALERALLLRDGLDPVKAHLASHIRLHTQSVQAVAAYCGVSERDAGKAVRSMVRCAHLLRSPNGCKRALVRFALRLARSRSIIDMLVPARDDEAYAEGNERLLACYARAVQKAVQLLENYRAFLAGDAQLDERLRSNYESEEII